MAFNSDQEKVTSPKVRRDQADEVFIATATERLRKNKAKTPKHMPEAQRKLKEQQAEEIVLKAQQKKGKR